MQAARSYDHVRDEAVKAAFLELDEKMQRVREIRVELKKSRDEKEEMRAELEEQREVLTKKIDAKVMKVQTIMQSVMPDRAQVLERQERAAMQDKRKVLMIKKQGLLAKINLVGQHFERAEQNNKRLTTIMEQVGTLKYDSLDEVEKLLKGMQSKISKADKNKDMVQLKKLMHDKKELEAAKGKLEKVKEYEEIVEKELMAAEAMNPEAAEAEIQQINAEIDAIKAEQDEYNEKFPPPTEQQRKERDAVRDEKWDAARKEADKVREEINKLKEERKNVGISPELKKKLDDLRVEKDALDKAIETIEKTKIPEKIVQVNEDNNETMSDLSGPGGVKARQFEEDFGVIIDMRRMEKQVVVRGKECEECAAMLKAVLVEEAKNRMELNVQIDPDLSAEFIGPQGSGIKLMETTSGTMIEYDRSGKVTIKGSEENIAKAMELITAFKESSHKESVKFGKHLNDVLRPSVAKQWQEDYSVRKVRIDLDAGQINVIGKADNVKLAAEEIDSILSNMSDNTIMLPSSVSHYSIIGPRGATVKAIQEQTKCNIDINEQKIVILGMKANIEEAKKLLLVKIKEEERDECRISYHPRMHNYLLRMRPIPQVHVDPEAEAETSPREGSRPPKTKEPLLETLRKKWNCDRLQADLKTKTIFIRGPKQSLNEVKEALKKQLEFEGFAKKQLNVGHACVRWLTVNKNGDRAKIETRLDAVREYEGVEEILADNRAESPLIDIIGTEEGVEKAAERIAKLQDLCEKHSVKMEVPSFCIGRILGTRGSNRQELEKDYDCMVHLPARDDSLDRNDLVQVTIIGRDMTAVHECAQAIADDCNN
eukprot:TRINITY_DN1379_c0_g1_i1.p2 TRINITY_DN1379_c0_g1~~TRINITY_DN1379_c0_g1_i1.p2  ORF type:complete len:825 (+),score=479.22 TRINITY_DN1379_c0_g1_i1:56-2530(+)